MTDLFAQAPAFASPLAEQLRPQHLDDVMGQSHLIGEGGPLRLAIAAGQLHSMLLWGPPGVGKTTLARILAQAFDAEFVALSAVFSGIKDIREAVERAQQLQQRGRKTILFVDEVHRFNKSQQDAFLPYVESGLLTFIGATTENPSFEVNPALLSRAQVYVLQSLQPEELKHVFARAHRTDILCDLIFDALSLDVLIGHADGDARRFLNLLEQTAHAAHSQNRTQIDADFLAQVLSVQVRRFDKGGEAFYDQISALHKSVRGSDPDAALYWLCRMLDGGADGLYLGRRIVRMAWEDIGLADPRAARVALDAVETYERLGAPEGELALGQAVIYLAVAAKSNAGYKAYNTARDFVRRTGSQAVPLHLRNAPTALMKELGYGHEYRYAHDEPHAYAAGAHYLPENMDRPNWYQPVPRGLETKIADKLAFLRELDRQAKKTHQD